MLEEVARGTLRKNLSFKVANASSQGVLKITEILEYEAKIESYSKGY